MSAQELRDAAALMRERAEAATSGRWDPMTGAFGDPSDGPDHMRVVADGWSTALDAAHTVSRTEYDQRGGDDAAHIAAADPTVMLAVADWLDAAYGEWLFHEHSLGAMSVRAMSGATNEPDPHALAVARAYMRNDQ